MRKAPASLVGYSLEWTGVHHSAGGDFEELSTHTVTYETATIRRRRRHVSKGPDAAAA